VPRVTRATSRAASSRPTRLLLGALCLSAAACSSGGVTVSATPSSSGPVAPAAPPSSPGVDPAASTAVGTPSGSPGATGPGSTGPSATDPSATDPGAATATPPAPSPTGPPAELPRGGRTIFPDFDVVMYYGTAGGGALGVLGETTPERAAERLETAAAPFERASGRPVLPAFELITTVASSAAGRDGTYSSMLDGDSVQRYIDAARKKKMLVVLDFQPGRAEFLDQVKKYEKYLLQPEVGVALDPEWKLTATQRPLQQIGVSRAEPINAVSEYLAGLVAANDLPEKIFLVHQFKSYQLPDRKKIVDREGLATVLHVDGFGTQSEKFLTYDVLTKQSKQFVPGFKLFYDEDTDLLTPAEALKIKPRPQLFSYQ